MKGQIFMKYHPLIVLKAAVDQSAFFFWMAGLFYGV